MTTIFSCDYIQFNEKGKYYDPFLDDKLKIITLDLSLASDLNWQEPKEAEKILWNLDFDLASISFYDQTVFASFLVGISSFIQQLYLPYQKQTFGVCLYQGPFFLPFHWNIEHKEAFVHWKQGFFSFPNPKDLYYVQVFSDYLHRLAAALPDEVLPFVFFNQMKGSPANRAQLLSREHFSYLFVGLRDDPLPFSPFNKEAVKARIGITLPLHANCSRKSVMLLDQVLGELWGSVRLVSEAYLTESWDRLDMLILFSDFISEQGKRKAQGFAAAGGLLITKGNPLGIKGEISWDEFRGRGI